MQQKRRVRPPWGDLLGGKPIERHVWTFDKKIDRHKHSLDNVQYLQMLRLMTFYGIGGDHQYPAATGVAPAPGLPWYQLSLTLACELDPSLRIVDFPAPSKTTARWRGHDGQVLLILVDAIKEVRPKSGLRWCLKEVQKYNELTFTSFRHGGFTEAGDAELTDREIMAQGRHKSPKVLGRYVKRTMRQVEAGAKKRRAVRTDVPVLSE